jgi:MtN3 and saliva related transmembrane protein
VLTSLPGITRLRESGVRVDRVGWPRLMTDALGITAATYGVLMAISPLLQIRRMFQTRSSADVSLGYLWVIEIGFGLWIAYGLSLPNLAIVVPNTVALTVGLATILVARHFRRAA